METRGRKPLPEGKRKAPQATVKINDFILPFVKELKGNLKKGVITGDTLSQLFFVLQGEAEQQASIFKDASAIGIIEELQEKIHLLEADLRIKDNKIISLNNSLKEKIVTPITESERGLLKKQYKDEHSRVVQLEGRVRSMESNIRQLKRNHDELLHREHDCMAIKGNGERCTKKAVIDIIQNRVTIHVCLQHSKVLTNKSRTIKR